MQASHPSSNQRTRKRGANIMERSVYVPATLALLALMFSFAFSYDPSPLQDFCVAAKEPKDALFVNGKFCKNPKLVTPDDFIFRGLQIPGNTANALGSNVNLITVDEFPGLNTLGMSLVRIDYAIGGLNPPHIHPRGSEVLEVLQGTLYVGFITSNPDNRLFSKVLNRGDAIVFPIGLIHFQLNVGKTNAVALARLNSQNPGLITVANALFNSTPPNNPEVLAKGLMVDEKFIINLQKKFASG